MSVRDVSILTDRSPCADTRLYQPLPLHIFQRVLQLVSSPAAGLSKFMLQAGQGRFLSYKAPRQIACQIGNDADFLVNKSDLTFSY